MDIGGRPSVVRCNLTWWLLGLLLGTAAAQADFLSSYKKARRAIDRGQWQVAIEALEEALADKDDAGELVRLYGVGFEPYLPYYFLGLAYYEAGDVRKALWVWEKAEREGAIFDSRYRKQFEDFRQAAEMATQGDVRVTEQSAQKPSASRPESSLREAARLPDLGSEGLERLESHALVVGISQYESRSAWSSLPGVLEDVPVVAAALRSHGFNVKILRDPTEDALDDAMDEFFFTTPKSEAARLVFYYAGHGATLETGGVQRGYLVPTDAPNAMLDPRGFRRRAISMARFQQYADESPARHVMFLFDSCFSGTVFDVVRSAGARGSVQEKVKEKSRMFIAAGDADQEVPDVSSFRRAFVEALEGPADLNQDGVIFGIELAQFIADQVMDKHRGEAKRQTPRWGRSGDHSKGDIPFRAEQ